MRRVKNAESTHKVVATVDLCSLENLRLACYNPSLTSFVFSLKGESITAVVVRLIKYSPRNLKLWLDIVGWIYGWMYGSFVVAAVW